MVDDIDQDEREPGFMADMARGLFHASAAFVAGGMTQAV